MKALTIKQPWAWAIFNGKDVENRDWPLPNKYIGQDVLIHAGKTFDYDGFMWLQKNPLLVDVMIPHQDNYVFGAILGKVTMTGCVIHSNSPWFFGPYGFTFENPILFKEPIPYRGALKFFDVPDLLITAEGGR